jgi:hypothetical protein
MAIWDPPTEIALLLYPNVASAMVHGLTDRFAVATTIARERIGAVSPWDKFCCLLSKEITATSVH